MKYFLFILVTVSFFACSQKKEPEGMQLVSSFKVTKGTKEFFTHPVIHDGVLYIRHGEALMAYSIRKNS